MADHPANDVLLTNLLVRNLLEEAAATPVLEHAFDTLLRHSDAGACARKIGLKVAGYAASEPVDAAGTWVMWLGSRIHEACQEVIAEQYGSAATIEARVRWDDLSASGHLDALIDIPDDSPRGFRRVTFELKTKGSFAFDKAVGLQRKGYKLDPRGPEGPGSLAKLQGALNAVASDSDELRIGIIAMEAVSKQLAERVNWGDEQRFLAEWSYPREVFEPWAHRERSRMAHILSVLDSQLLPDRWAIDDEMEPVYLNPDSERPPWQCSYCQMRSLCSFAGRGEVALPLAGVPVP